jgi:hypothetical protein
MYINVYIHCLAMRFTSEHLQERFTEYFQPHVHGIHYIVELVTVFGVHKVISLLRVTFAVHPCGRYVRESAVVCDGVSHNQDRVCVQCAHRALSAVGVKNG